MSSNGLSSGFPDAVVIAEPDTGEAGTQDEEGGKGDSTEPSTHDVSPRVVTVGGQFCGGAAKSDTDIHGLIPPVAI